MKNTKIAILYICTGQYKIFWDGFYNSFQRYFLPNCQKEYFVFTDKDDLCREENVHLIYIEHREWPYNTLLRFEFFLSIREKLEQFHYIFFFNANMKCNKNIIEKEFLPNVSNGENLVVAIHPIYENKKSRHCPFERNKKSRAYVPYSSKSKYVAGGLNGGEKNAYLSLIIELSSSIKKDMENNIIAKVNDESYLNEYISRYSNKKVKYLSPSYLYPLDLKFDYPAYIILLNKKEYFDIASFKSSEKRSLLYRGIHKVKRYFWEDIAYAISLIKGEKTK